MVSGLLLQFHGHLKLLETLLELTCTINAINFNLVLVVSEHFKNVIRSKPRRLLCIAKLLMCFHLKAVTLQLRNSFFLTDFLDLQYCFASTKLCQAIWKVSSVRRQIKTR